MSEPPAPKLPEVDSPPAEAILDDVPSKDDVIEGAQPAEAVVEEQPSVREVLGDADAGGTSGR
jgi:hypothetical protein